MKTHKFIILFVACIAFAVSACVYIPETNKKAFIVTSPSFENQLGTDGYKEVLAQSKLDGDPKLNGILRRVGSRIASQTQNTGFNWEYKLIESKEQNAWCMPGGKIAVYTAILPVMHNEAGMAAVLGHEVAHAVLRHSGQRISQQLIVNLGLSLAEVSLRNKKYKNTIIGLLGAGAAVGVILPYSRTHEKEADVVGLKYMARAGYDPQEAVKFWQRFAKQGGGAPPEFLSTHPGSSTRISLLKENMPEAQRLYLASSNKYGAGDTLLK